MRSSHDNPASSSFSSRVNVIEFERMKLRKVNLVEVLRKEHDPCGSWFLASIVSADGDNFIVRFKSLIDREGKEIVEKVHEMYLRPLPPDVKGQTWTVGDMAEVFDARCWRIGEVAKVLQENNRVVIRFLGSIKLKEFDVSNLRIRQVWCDNEWKMIRKVIQEKQFSNSFRPNNSDFAQRLLSRTPSEIRCRDLDIREEDGEGHFKYWPDYDENSLDVLIGGSCKKRKSLPCSRGCEKPSRRNIALFKQVNDTSYSHIRVEEKFIQKSTENNNRVTLRCLDDSCRPLWSTEDSNQCSVASCSANNIADHPIFISHKSPEISPDNSDAESAFPSMSYKRGLGSFPVQKLKVNIHELELHAYKSTMEAMYALGPLSWDQESLLTNLRLSLNISDEEHLIQIRHLLSTQVL